jgi:hypothetical protein
MGGEGDLDVNQASLGTAVIDPAGRYAYFGTDTSEDDEDESNGESVVRIDLATFTRAGTLHIPGAGLESAVMDPAGRFAYFGTDDLEFDSGTLVRIDLATFERVARASPGGRGRGLISAVIDPAGRFVYFGTRPGGVWGHGPGWRVVRAALRPERLPALEGRVATSYTTADGWAAHLAADVDGDGHADLVSYHPKRGRWWLSRGRANGTFDPPRLATTYTTADGWQTHLAADVDGDGRADLLSYHPRRGRWWLSRGRANGTFDPPELAATYASTDGWQTHLAADVDGDGRADLLSYHPKHGRWWVSPSGDGGSFAAPRVILSYHSRYPTAHWGAHLTADVDADGKADVLSYGPANGRWVVYDHWPLRDPWVLTESWTMTWTSGIGDVAILYGTTTGWQAHLAADVTGDGRADVLSYHPARGRWSITTSRDYAWFDEPRTLTTYGTTTGWQTHLAADVTGDGRAELLSYHPGRGRWWVTTPTGKR